MTQFLIGAALRDRREHKDRTMSDSTMSEGETQSDMLGHNQPPPQLINNAQDTYQALSLFLQDTPVIQHHDDAKRAAEYQDHTKKTLADMEAERKARVEPYKTKAAAIDALYRAARLPIERALDELRKRLTIYATVEEAKRIAEAERLRAEAAAAEQAARAAEESERTAIDNAQVGECADVGAAIAHADSAFSEFQRAQRAADIAARDATVRLAVPGGRAQTMRTVEMLVLTDAAAALAALGATEKIRDAILSEARAYRKQHGALPNGVAVEYVRSM